MLSFRRLFRSALVTSQRIAQTPRGFFGRVGIGRQNDRSSKVAITLCQRLLLGCHGDEPRVTEVAQGTDDGGVRIGVGQRRRYRRWRSSGSMRPDGASRSGPRTRTRVGGTWSPTGG